MGETAVRPIITCHVAAIPYPGRGHINPMMNLCKLLASRRPDFLITFIVTEEWLGFLSSGSEASRPDNIRFRSIPNVIPSELVRGADFPGFIEATSTKLESPVEDLLDRIETPASLLIYDTYLTWVVGLGNRKNIPVASLYPMPATVFSLFHHLELLVQNGHYLSNLQERGEEQVNYIPGVPSMRVMDLPTPLITKGIDSVFARTKQSMSCLPKAHYLLFSSIYEFEEKVIDALKTEFRIPIYPVGPLIPYFELNSQRSNKNDPDYMTWLDNQSKASVLYISQGSFLSVSSAQLEELIEGVHQSGVPYLWVARGDVSRFEGKNGNDNGLVVSWCDQLRVLCHDSIGGFLSHCGWNSIKESVFAGVPMLTFPIFWDQDPNSKMIVEDWKIGRRAIRNDGVTVTRDEIAELVKDFMNLESEDGEKMRRRVQELKGVFRQAIGKGGSAEVNIDAFISDVLKQRECL